MVIRLLIIPAVILAIYSLFDLFSSDTRRRAGLSPLLWVLIIVLIPILGPIAWIIISRSGQAGRPGMSGGQAPGDDPQYRRSGPQGPRAPDDDPEFLWRLQQQQRRMQEQRKKEAENQGSDGPEASDKKKPGQPDNDEPEQDGN